MTMAKLSLAAIIIGLVLGSVGCSGPSGCSTATPGQSGGSSSGGSGGATQSSGACGTTGGGNPIVTGTPAAFSYYVNMGTLGATMVDTSGNFGQLVNFNTPLVSTLDAIGGMVAVQKKWLYVAVGLGIDAYAITGSTGALTVITGSPFTFSGTEVYSLATDAAGKFLFVCAANNDMVQVYTINQTTGALTPVGTFSTAGFSAQATSDGLGKYLYVTAGNLGNTVDVYSIGASGALTPIAGSPFFIAIATLRSEPTGKFLVGVTGNGAKNGVGSDNNVYVFSIDQSSGAPTPVNGSPFATTYIPANLAVHPNGTLVYTFNGTVTGTTSPMEGFQLNTTTGAVTPLATSPFSNMTATMGQFDQNGTYLFTNSAGTQSLASVNTSTGALTNVGSSITGVGASPAWAVTDPQ
jgi:6-phosphogluconolactonase (cycloisomerase 2 family)